MSYYLFGQRERAGDQHNSSEGSYCIERLRASQGREDAQKSQSDLLGPFCFGTMRFIVGRYLTIESLIFRDIEGKS
jgi:hypothetical protein